MLCGHDVTGAGESDLSERDRSWEFIGEGAALGRGGGSNQGWEGSTPSSDDPKIVLLRR